MRAVVLLIFVVVLCLSFVAYGTYVTTLNFNNITANDAGNAAAGEAGLFLDIYSQFDAGGDEQILFTFRNESSAGGVIAEIYFEDNMLLAGGDIFDNPLAVDFEEDFGSNNLPGGAMIVPSFEVTRSFFAVNPAPKRGVGVGEQVGIVFDLQAVGGVSNILNDLGTGGVRVGLHVVSFANGNSESFVNDEDFDVIPEPMTLGLICLGAVLARRNRKI